MSCSFDAANRMRILVVKTEGRRLSCSLDKWSGSLTSFSTELWTACTFRNRNTQLISV